MPQSRCNIFTVLAVFQSGCGGISVVPSMFSENISPNLAAPVLVNAGADREVLRGYETYLDGTGTIHPQGKRFSTRWEQLAGESVYLSMATGQNGSGLTPSFVTPLKEQKLVFRLTATDGRFETHDDVTLYVKRDPNKFAPSIQAGPDRFLAIGESYEPAKSDAEGADAVATRWEQINSTKIRLDSSNEESAPFVYRLVGVQNDLESAPDYLVLWPFTEENLGARAPIAAIEGPLVAQPGELVVLDASATTDPNGDSVSFRWQQTLGERVDLVSPFGPLVSFVAPSYPQDISMRVFARDDTLESAPSEINIEVGVGMGELLPTVRPGSDQRARPERWVELDAQGGINSAVEPTTTQFVWEQTWGTKVDLIFELDGRLASFQAEKPGELAFAVVGLVDGLSTAPEVTRVTVVDEDDNLPPKIHLWATNREPEAGERVEVSALIVDPENDPFECEWLTEVQPDEKVSFEPADCSSSEQEEVSTSFVAPAANTTVTITITLRVTDSFSAVASESITIVVASF